MGYERRVWDQEGTICPAPVTARKPSTCEPFSDEESSFASCGKQRRKAQFAPDRIPGPEPVNQGKLASDNLSRSSPRTVSPAVESVAKSRTLATKWDHSLAGQAEV